MTVLNTTTEPDLDIDYIQDRINYESTKLVGTYGLKTQDFEDIKQELFLELWPKLEKYDQEKSSLKTYICCMLKASVATFVRKQKQRNVTQSKAFCFADLDYDDVKDEGRSFVDSVIDPHSQHASDQVDQRIDMAIIFESLTDEEQRVHTAVKQSNQYAASQTLGMTRHRIHNVLESIKEKFTAAGYSTYDMYSNRTNNL